MTRYLAPVPVDGTLAPLTLLADETAVHALHFGTPETVAAALGGEMPHRGTNAVLTRALDELAAYLRGELTVLAVPLSPPAVGSFSHAVLAALTEIPHGETRTYVQVAEAIGNPRAVRAVGQACARNPLPILIPCHRVVPAHGRDIGNYAGGLARKRYLLELEARTISGH